MIEQTEIRRLYDLCHYYGIDRRPDAMWMDEFTWGQGRFDILTMDLQNWTVRGYEIKLSRQDFLGDRKWQNYLPYCHFFFFASVPDVIHPGDLPEEIGHLELGESGLILRKKPRRLQPSFVRQTYGEQFVTRLLLGFVRALGWRDSRLNQCVCGRWNPAIDPRISQRFQIPVKTGDFI